MLSKCYSGALYGVEARTVEIAVFSASGSPQFTIVGLPDQAVKEAKDRVSTAIGNSGFKRVESNVTVNLAPADVRKEGPLYDLPIATGLLVATGRIACPDLQEYGLAGELALSGEVRRVGGILPIALEMRRIGNTLIGSAPELIRDYLEVRGVGVIDIQKIFGMGAVQESTQIDLVIKFEEWTDGYVYDRLGLDDDYMQILDISVPCVTIPVRAGRNLAGIAEIAAMNNRQKKYGFNSAQAFVEKIDSHVDANSKK